MRRLAWATLAGLALAFTVAMAAGFHLCRATRHPVPAQPGIPFERVEIRGEGGRLTVAWVSIGASPSGFVLAHGNSSDRNAMVPRMSYLASLGHSVIAPDLHAHGESDGDFKTFGHLESQDVAHAAAYLRQKSGADWIGAIGTSLGGAAILKAVSESAAFDAIVIESVFSDIRTAARNRLEMRFGAAAGILEPLLTGQLPIWIGISGKDLAPVLWATKCRVPALILGGSEDERARPKESEAIFAAMPTDEKRIGIFQGAGHVDLFAFDRVKYLAELERFLAERGVNIAAQVE